MLMSYNHCHRVKKFLALRVNRKMALSCVIGFNLGKSFWRSTEVAFAHLTQHPGLTHPDWPMHKIDIRTLEVKPINIKSIKITLTIYFRLSQLFRQPNNKNEHNNPNHTFSHLPVSSYLCRGTFYAIQWQT